MSTSCVLRRAQTDSSHIASGPSAIPNERDVELTSMISGLLIFEKSPVKCFLVKWEPMCVTDLIIKCIELQETLTESVSEPS